MTAIYVSCLFMQVFTAISAVFTYKAYRELKHIREYLDDKHCDYGWTEEDGWGE